jgi:hypothetical protein
MRIRLRALLILVTACSTPETKEEEGRSPVTVSLDEFRQLQWITGSWRGSGGAYPAFFEEYRVVDDSTIQMRALSDSTFSVATDSSWIELRNGQVRSRGGDRQNVVIALSPDSVRFARPGETRGGHTFTRISSDQWNATLHPGSPDGEPTVYVMRRVQR